MLEEPLSSAVEERNTAEECEAPAPPRVAWENNSSENHSRWMRFCAGVLRVWRAWKRLFQTNETQGGAFVPSPTRLTQVPFDFIREGIYFKARYEVGLKLKSIGDRTDYCGSRISDDKQVLIRCIKKSRPETLVESPAFPIPMSREAAAMLMLQKPPASTHILQLYDMYILKDQDVLVLEYSHSNITLFEFHHRNRGSLKESAVKHIVWQLVVALQHCIDHGVYQRTHMKNVLINPYTLKVKLTDFEDTLFFEDPRLYTEAREFAECNATKDIYELLDQLITRITLWFPQRSPMSKEFLDLLKKLDGRGSRITLDAILDHGWFKNPQGEER